MPRPAPPPELTRAALERFLTLYAAGAYFDAHEALEVAWRRSDAPPMPVLQGLIQWAVAFEHHRRGNAHGARVLLARAWSRLGGAPDDGGGLGLDLVPLKAAHGRLARALAAWDAGGGRPVLVAPPITGRGAGPDH